MLKKNKDLKTKIKKLTDLKCIVDKYNPKLSII